MKPFKPLVLKTYGKQKRKICAWISPEDRKRRVFDSTSSSENTSLIEPSTKQRTRRENHKRDGGLREMRPAKRKALQCLTEKNLDDEDVPLHKLVSVHHANTTSVCSDRRHTKEKARLLLTEISSWDKNPSDEENVSPPSWPVSKNRSTRKSSLASLPTYTRQRGQIVSVTSESEEETSALKHQRISVKMKTNSIARLPSTGRFVTRRRCAATSKLPKARIFTPNSSDDFTSGALHFSGIYRRSRRRRVPQPFGLSRAESSMNTAGPSRSTAVPFREISLNESGDHSLGPCSTKPIFCSTPSAASFGKLLKPFAFQTATPQSVSVSCIDQDSPPQTASLSGHSDEKFQRGSTNQSLNLFTESERESSSEVSERLSRDSQTKNDGELSSVAVLSTGCESSSLFVSAAGGLEWLIEALKQKCLSQRCTVQLERLAYLPVTEALKQKCLRRRCTVRLERLDYLPVTLPCSPTTYSSCLECSSFCPSVSESDIAKGSPSDDCKETAKLSNIKAHAEQSGSVIYAGSTHLSDPDSELDTQLLAGTVQTQSASQEVKTDMNEHVSVKHSDPLRSILSSKVPLQGPARADAARHERSVDQDANRSEKEGSTVSLRKSKDRPAADSVGRLNGHDSDENATSGVNSKGSTSSELTSGHEGKNSSKTVSKRKKDSLAPKEKKRRSVFSNQTGTARKVCVSGMSVSRWKNKGCDGGTLAFGTAIRSKAVDCSISELISEQHNQPTDLGATGIFSTPLRTGHPRLTSLLADLSPSKHTWSRLKAALSVHRKVQLTPSSFNHLARGSPVITSEDASFDLFATPLRAALFSHLPSQRPSHGSSDLYEETDLSDAMKVYAECGQQRPLPWVECILPRRMRRCTKIGEGTFGEVFSTTSTSGDTVALKIIPVEGRQKVNGEDQKTFGEILHEIIISKELSSLKGKKQNQTHGFIGLHDLHCVQGCYPADFLKAWDAFDQRKVSENDRPDFFENDQLFIILEFEFGGIDLENSNGTLASVGVAKSILHQVTAALAVAEQELHFEHRDLHWGNVLVKATKQKTADVVLNGTSHCVETKGVLVRIIDYSLSRLEIDDLTVSCDISNDEELFMGQGDYQFDIYRLMRQENGNNWNNYHPHSNVLWLHYLCSKLLSMKYRSNRGKAAVETRKQLTGFKDNILQYCSATEMLQNCTMFQLH